MAKNKEEFFMCDCHSEGLYLVADKEDKLVYASFFSIGINPKQLNFFGKIRYIWNILKSGKPFEDQLVFSFDKTKKLAAKLIQLSK